MPIIIENTGGNPSGNSRYLLRINEKIITDFKHHRPDGLAQCLKKAYKAAQKIEAETRGKSLKGLRLEVGLTLRDVGRIAGVSISYVSDIECGRKPFSKVARKIEAILTEKKAGILIDSTP